MIIGHYSRKQHDSGFYRHFFNAARQFVDVGNKAWLGGVYRMVLRNPCRSFPLIKALLLVKNPIIQRVTAKDTSIPGVSPTNLGGPAEILSQRTWAGYPKTSSWLLRRELIPPIAIST